MVYATGMYAPLNLPPESTEGTPTLTVGDVARALGVSIETVRKWGDRGVLPFTPRRAQYPGMVEPVRVFSEEDLDRLRAWFVEWEDTRPAGGRPPHVKRNRKPGEEGATA